MAYRDQLVSIYEKQPDATFSKRVDMLIQIAMDLIDPQHLRHWLLTAATVLHKTANRCSISASGNRQGFVKIWNWKTLKRLGSVPSHSSTVNAIAFSPRQKVLVTGGDDGKIKIISYKNDIEDQGLLGEYSDWIGGVNTLAFSPDGEIVTSGDDDGKVKLWNIKNKTQIREFSGHNKSVMSVSFSPDGKLLASSGKDYTVRIWQPS